VNLPQRDADAHSVLDPDTYLAGAPLDALRRLRRQAPVHRVELPDRPPAWLVTRHADVTAASRDHEHFSSEEGNTFVDLRVPEGSAMLPSLDPPRHTHYRTLINRGFTPRNVARLESRVREIASGIVDQVVAAGEVEIVSSISAEISLQVIAEVMGIPLEDRDKIFRWSNAIGSLGVEDPDYAPSPDALMAAAGEMYVYCAALLEQRRTEAPRDDILSALLSAEVDGQQLTDAQLNEFFMLLSVAGNETTRNTLSHGLLALSDNPEQQQHLVGDRSAIPSAVEEMVRWASPVLHFRRTVKQDIEFGGQRLRKGDWVVLHYLSANRDEDAFAAPDRFDVRRDPNPHVSFGGGGAHFCLGAQLARLELRVLLEELLDRAPRFHVTGPPDRLRSAFFHGIKRLPGSTERTS